MPKSRARKRKPKPKPKPTKPVRRARFAAPAVNGIDEQLLRTRQNFLHFLPEVQADQYRRDLSTLLEVINFPDRSITLPAPDAHTALTRAIKVLADDALAQANRYSSSHWLLGLRLMPADVFGPGRSYIERRFTAEVLSSIGAPPPIDAVSQEGEYTFEAGDEDHRHMLRFACLTKTVQNLRVLQRIAAKDVPICFFRDKMPQPDRTHRHWPSVQLYDARLQANGQLDLISGTIATSETDDVSIDYGTLLGVSFRDYVPFEQSLNETNEIWSDTLRDWGFRLSREHTRVPELFRHFHWYSHELPALSFAMRTLLLGIWEAGQGTQRMLRRLGVGMLTQQQVIDAFSWGLQEQGELDRIANLFPAANPGSWTPEYVFDIASQPATLSPLRPGPLLRVAPNSVVCVDPVAGTYRIGQELAPSSSGDTMSDTRGKDFEACIQSMVDRTPWKPPPSLRRYVGKDVKRSDGSVFTDLDAIAYRDGVGVFIDAKSLVRPAALEGDYAATRNVRTDLETYVEKWRQKVAVLGAAPVSGKYDVSVCREFVPLIVTPGAHYVYDNLLEPRLLKSLHPVATYAELQRRLLDDV